MIVFEPATPTALSLALKHEAKLVFPHITRDGRLRARGSDPLPAYVRAPPLQAGGAVRPNPPYLLLAPSPPPHVPQVKSC